METHRIKDVSIMVDEKQIASLPEAVVNLDISKIEIVIEEVLLSTETLGLLKLGLDQTPKEFDVTGAVDDKALTVKRAIVSHFTFEAETGKAVRLRNISILGLSAEWKFEKRSL